MRDFKNQKGISLWSVVFVGAAILLGIVYGRHVINIHYNNYVLSEKSKDIARENVGKDDKTILKSLRDRAAFEKIDGIYADSDVVITKDNSKVDIEITYRECATLNANWEICADMKAGTK